MEGMVAKQALDEGPRAGIFLCKSQVLSAELIVLLNLALDFTFELANVLCVVLAQFWLIEIWH